MTIRATLFDLGNTLVSYFTRAQVPAVLERAIGAVAGVGCFDMGPRAAMVPEDWQ